MDAIVIAPYSQLQLKDVIRSAEEDLLRAIGSGLQSINYDIERSSLQCGNQCLPIARDKLGFAAHRDGEGIDHLLFITNVAIWIGRIGENVGCAATRISAPAQGLLRACRNDTEQERDERPGELSFQRRPRVGVLLSS